MFNSKYSAVLTIILIILIIAIIIMGLIFGIRIYKNLTEEKEKERVFSELVNGDENQNKNKNKNEVDDITIIELPSLIDTNTTQENNNTTQDATPRRKTTLYRNYPVVGYIKISKTRVSYPILLDITEGALDVAVGVIYPNNPKLNQPGNVVIIGHNYRNGKFFSNNKDLAIGDKIEITDLEGKTLTYTIYDKFTTTSTDTSFWTRDRGGNIEISLSTCTDDTKGRLVLLARAD